jgi:hypothetical protein
MNNTNTKEQVADSNGAHTEQPIINQLINEFREWNRQWDFSKTTMTIDEFCESLTKKYHVSLSNSSTISSTDKTLLPDNVNTAEEYIEYLNAIGYWDYVKNLEKFKEQMSNDKKQTAVEWLEEIINKNGLQMSDYLKFTFEQAKEMEKENMIEFGELVWKNLLRSDKIMKPIDVYNETYGGNK